jgi:hypothetical protein
LRRSSAIGAAAVLLGVPAADEGAGAPDRLARRVRRARLDGFALSWSRLPFKIIGAKLAILGRSITNFAPMILTTP